VTLPEPVFPVVLAGDPNGLPGDSPTQRVDPNTASSPFAGVGSIVVQTGNTSELGTGALIGRRYVLTAAHVVDLNNDGKFDAKDGTTGIYFILNAGGDATEKIAVSQVDIDPFFTGFNHPSINDDIAVLTLAEDVPDGIPIYPVGGNLIAGEIISWVGYGRSGDGVHGYTTSASPTVKRLGQNVVDAFYGQDDKGQPEVNEVYRFDFDGPKGNGPLGGGTLGNNIESQLGMGDSGAPAFVLTDSGYTIVGVSTYIQGANAPKFGSMGGGMVVSAYLDFIYSIIGPPASGDGGTGDNPDISFVTARVPGSYTDPTVPISKGGAGRHTRAKAISTEFVANFLASSPTTTPSDTGLFVSPPLNRASDDSDKGDVSKVPDRLSYEFARRVDDPLLYAGSQTAIDLLAGLDIGSTYLLSTDGIFADE
jgi:hypothetical protein